MPRNLDDTDDVVKPPDTPYPREGLELVVPEEEPPYPLGRYCWEYGHRYLGPHTHRLLRRPRRLPGWLARLVGRRGKMSEKNSATTRTETVFRTAPTVGEDFIRRFEDHLNAACSCMSYECRSCETGEPLLAELRAVPETPGELDAEELDPNAPWNIAGVDR